MMFSLSGCDSGGRAGGLILALFSDSERQIAIMCLHKRGKN